MAGQEQVPPGAGQEAEVLALAPVRHGQLGIARELTDHRLLELAEREPQPGQVVRVEARKHGRLVLARVGRAQQGSRAVLHDARVVTGREPPGTQLGSGLQHGAFSTWPLHSTQGFGVRLAAFARKSWTTRSLNGARRSRVSEGCRCGASARAPP